MKNLLKLIGTALAVIIGGFILIALIDSGTNTVDQNEASFALPKNTLPLFHIPWASKSRLAIGHIDAIAGVGKMRFGAKGTTQ